jgi:hypothetical protein
MNILVDDIAKVVAAMKAEWNRDDAPYYLYGHKVEINRMLLQRGKHHTLKFQLYPLVALNMDFPEDVVNGMQNYTLNLAILAMTDKDYNTEERYEHVFRPILYPLYRLFLKHLRFSGLFTWGGDQEFPPHTKLDRPYWGIEQGQGNVRKIFSDPLDAIELLNLKINSNVKCKL